MCPLHVSQRRPSAPLPPPPPAQKPPPAGLRAQAWVAAQPDSWAAHLYLARALLEHGNAEQAGLAALNALKLTQGRAVEDTGMAQVIQVLVEARSRLGHLQAVEHYCRQWIKLEPDNPDPRLYLALAALGARRWQDAFQEAGRFLELLAAYQQDSNPVRPFMVKTASRRSQALAVRLLAAERLGRDGEARAAQRELEEAEGGAEALAAVRAVMEEGRA